MREKKTNGVWLGIQWLEEGEYTINGGKGNKLLMEIKVEDGHLYIKEDGEWLLCDHTFFNLPRRKDNLKVIDDSEVNYFNIINIREV